MAFAASDIALMAARGFSRGSVFTREGVLIASVTQEGLMRKRETGFVVT